MTNLMLLLATLYVLLSAAVYLVADRLIFLPPEGSYAPEQLPVTFVTTADGARIATLHLPRPGATFTILYSHGNAEDLGHVRPVLEEIGLGGFSVLAYDYRGYGLSTGGPPTAAGANEDLEAVYRYAIEVLRLDPSRVIVHGRSVGSGPATKLAAGHEVGGLVLESAFVSVFRVVTRVGLLPFDRFPNLRLLRRVDVPVLVIHGTRDEVIPPGHGRRLFEAAGEPKRMVWVEGAGHNDLVSVTGDRYRAALSDFADLIERKRVTRRPDR